MLNSEQRRILQGSALLCIICIVKPIPAMGASTYENDMKKAVVKFIEHKIKLNSGETLIVNFGNFKKHIKIKSCPSGFNVNFMNNAEQSSTVEVSCSNWPAWHIYLPIDIQIFSKVAVARTMIVPGQTIKNNDIIMNPRNKNILYDGFFSSAAEVYGKVAYRIIQPNAVITQKNIHPPILIKKNQTILVVSKKNNVSVTMEGIAAENGYLHESIKVMNQSSQKMIDAVVVGPSKAEINISDS